MKSTPIHYLSSFLFITFGMGFLLCGRSFAETSSKLKPGMVVVAKVTGKVEASAPKRQRSQLKKHEFISEDHTVFVDAASSTTLAFSNGAVVNLLENSKLVISQFLQDPFSSPFTKTITTTEPATSTTRLNLVQGEMISSVKKLQTDQGSSLIVETPVGAAGVRGTIYSISYITDANDPSLATFTLAVTEGLVDFTDKNGKKVSVPAGKELVIKVRQSVDPQTEEIIILEILEFFIRDISAKNANRINGIAEEGIDLSNGIFMDVLDLDKLLLMSPVRDFPVMMVHPPVISKTDP